MNDIPNYVALPVGVIASLFFSIFVAIYQNKIVDSWNKMRNESQFASEERARSSYNEIKMMSEDERILNNSRYDVISLSLLCIFGLVIILLLLVVFINIFNERNIVTEGVFIMLAALAVSIVSMFSVSVVKVDTKIRNAMDFERYTARIRERWGNIFE